MRRRASSLLLCRRLLLLWRTSHVVVLVIGRLDAAQVVTEAASADHVRLLRHYWQLPMYHLDFKEAAVPLETLQADREAQLWAEAGYGPEYG